MNPFASFSLHRRFALAVALIIASSTLTMVAADATLLDDFSDSKRTHHGAARLVIDDKEMGSQSHATQTCENGLLQVKGELVPGRGCRHLSACLCRLRLTPGRRI